MHPLAKLGFVAVGLSLALSSLVACAITNGEETGSSESDLFRRSGPGNGRRPIGPIIAPDKEDAAAPEVADLGIAEADAEAPPADDAGAPVVDPDAEAPPPVVEEDASAPPLEPDAG